MRLGAFPGPLGRQPGKPTSWTRTTLAEFARHYDLFDRGVDAIARGAEERIDIAFSLFHGDKVKDYRLDASFLPRDVVVDEGELFHEEGLFFGKVLDLRLDDGGLHLGAPSRRVRQAGPR